MQSARCGHVRPTQLLRQQPRYEIAITAWHEHIIAFGGILPSPNLVRELRHVHKTANGTAVAVLLNIETNEIHVDKEGHEVAYSLFVDSFNDLTIPVKYFAEESRILS